MNGLYICINSKFVTQASPLSTDNNYQARWVCNLLLRSSNLCQIHIAEYVYVEFLTSRIQKRDSYMVVKDIHRHYKKIQLAAVDSCVSSHFYLDDCMKEAHDQTRPTIYVGCANKEVMNSPELTLKFKGETVDVSEKNGNILITGHPDPVKNLFMVPCKSEAADQQRVQRI